MLLQTLLFTITAIAGLQYAPDAGDAHRLDLYLPSSARARAPVVVFVHGGAFMGGDRRDYAFIGRALAGQGMACAVVSYRLFPQTDAAGATEDVAWAAQWVVLHAPAYGLDARRLFLVGHSAGGQIVALLGTAPAFLERAGLSLGAVRGVVPVAGAYDVRDLSGEPESWQIVDGHIYGKTAAERAAVSPSTYASAAAPPMLVACGTNDDPEACDRGLAFVRRLREAGAQATVVRVVGADHLGLLRELADPKSPLNAAFVAFVQERAADVALATPPPSPIDALDRYRGTWHSTGTFVNSPYSKAGTVSATTRCEWTADRSFLVCQQQIAMGDGQTSSDVALYTYDPAAKKYRFFGIRPNGGNDMTIDVDATSVTYPGSFDDGGKHVLQRTVNVWETPDRYTYRSEYSTDGGAHWTVTLSGVSERGN